MRAVRIDGKPRQLFVLGLGSLKDKPGSEYEHVCFWTGAIFGMIRFGLSQARRAAFRRADGAKGRQAANTGSSNEGNTKRLASHGGAGARRLHQRWDVDELMPRARSQKPAVNTRSRSFKAAEPGRPLSQCA